MTNFVGVVYHPKREDAREVARQAAEIIGRQGANVVTLPAWDDEAILAALPGWQLVVTCGGDGTILRTTRLAAPSGVPQLGINVGRLGFLAELKPEEMADKLPLYLKGEYWLEQRSMVRATLWLANGQATLAADIAASPGQQFDALNEVLLTRSGLPRVIRVKVAIDGVTYTTLVGDGVMLATPTGSTAYSLAAGGPVVSPQVADLILTAVCPHPVRSVPLVLPPTSKVTLQIVGAQPAMLSIDGQVDIAVGAGDLIEVSASPFVARFVRARSPGYFYELIGRTLR